MPVSFMTELFSNYPFDFNKRNSLEFKKEVLFDFKMENTFNLFKRNQRLIIKEIPLKEFRLTLLKEMP